MSPPTRDAVLSAAASLCLRQGARLTSLRRATLDTLLSAEQPLGAYEVMRRVQATLGRKLLAPSIYRVLDFLVAHGLAARIESRSAYVAAVNPDKPHLSLYFLCDECGAAWEAEGDRVQALISESAATLGFKVGRRVLECAGICTQCQANPTAHSP
jgi:Fur family zinc uptake transcriptional regulator